MHRCSAVGLLATMALLAACGSTPAPSSSTTASARLSPTATPPPPDVEKVSVDAVGIGTYELVAIPVAIVHNHATRHGAAQVVVRFTALTASGRTLGSLESLPVNLAPGESIPVAADCTDACTGARSATATAKVGSWVITSGAAVTASSPRYRCQSCGGPHAHGDVIGILSANLGSGAAVSLFAACRSGAGAVIGGGVSQVIWPGGTRLAVDVPVIVNGSPAQCTLGASTGW